MSIIVTTPEELESLIDRSVAKAMDKWTGMYRNIDKYPEILSMKQAQALLGVSRAKLLNMVAAGDIQFVSKPGEHYRFLKSKLVNLL